MWNAHFCHRNLELLSQSLGDARLVEQIAAGRLAGQGLDAAHAGGNAAFANDLEQSNIAGAGYVGATAQLDRPAQSIACWIAHRDDPNLIAILFAE